MKRLTALFCIILLLFSCSKSNADFTDTSIVFTDETYTSVMLPYKPQKVAVLFSSFADIWTCAGGDIAITVNESIDRGFADETAILVDGGAGKNIDTEKLIASSPDLVICSADIAAQLDTVMLCRSVGIPAIALKVECFEDYLDVLKLFTTLTGCDENYITYGENVKKEIDSITSASYSDTVLFIRASSSAKATKAKRAKDHFAAAMLEEFGVRNVADNAPVLLDGLSLEEILTENPDRIFITTMGDENAAKEYMNSLLSTKEWSSLSAVKNGKVYFLPKELFQYKPNSNWANAYKYIADILKGD